MRDKLCVFFKKNGSPNAHTLYHRVWLLIDSLLDLNISQLNLAMSKTQRFCQKLNLGTKDIDADSPQCQHWPFQEQHSPERCAHHKNSVDLLPRRKIAVALATPIPSPPCQKQPSPARPTPPTLQRGSMANKAILRYINLDMLHMLGPSSLTIFHNNVVSNWWFARGPGFVSSRCKSHKRQMIHQHSLNTLKIRKFELGIPLFQPKQLGQNVQWPGKYIQDIHNMWIFA